MPRPLLTPREQEEVEQAQQKLRPASCLIFPLVFDEFTTTNKGLGCRANQIIPAGSLILKERPLFSIENVSDPLSDSNGTEIAAQAGAHPSFTSLSSPDPGNDARRFEVNNFDMPKDDEKFDSAGGRQNHHQRETRRTTRQRSRPQSQPSDTASDQPQGRRQGIFICAARFNHSCIPNAHHSWDDDLSMIVIYACTDIFLHQEIVVNYLPSLRHDTSADRQAELERVYEFRCDCSACKHWNNSEKNRAELKPLKEKIENRGTGKADRNQVFKELWDFRGLLRWSGLVYPDEAWVHTQFAKRYKAEESQRPEHAVIPLLSARTLKLEAIREALKFDVMCTGGTSHDTRVTLKLMNTLRL